MLKKARGGKRPGAGMPKGYKTAKTRDKEQARAFYQAYMTKRMELLNDVQFTTATGVSQFVYRDEQGRFKVIDDPDELRSCVTMGKAIRIFTRLPNAQAQTDILNRIMDKPAEQLKVTGEDGGPVEHVFRWKDKNP